MSKRPTIFRNNSKLRQYLTIGVFVVLAVSSVWKNSQEGQSNNSPGASGDYVLSAQVQKVSDGDTFNLQIDGKTHRIRMASIDAPETHKSARQPGQPHAQASRDFLSSLIAGKQVELQCFEQDLHGRDVCDVYLSDGMKANEEMVAAGYAWANTEKKGLFLRDKQLLDIQQRARSEKRGLWQDASATEPWVWRYECWQQGKC
ncbi:thermonuclease family protein [Paenalcaligenes niemegkensis]|uniref:thermonuclease family protein n=1 Tax=Paenalcaligenes niemegkensis TaxID=2895469 RepID=UPI001EE85F45|nr:thermonuclease family protein [Paenalcaligenes niemegkensis]MCQ9615685.1 thermonuclease family protein [Paenalcaligenes niemegkensis]